MRVISKHCMSTSTLVMCPYKTKSTVMKEVRLDSPLGTVGIKDSMIYTPFLDNMF